MKIIQNEKKTIVDKIIQKAIHKKQKQRECR